MKFPTLWTTGLTKAMNTTPEGQIQFQILDIIVNIFYQTLDNLREKF